MAQAINKIYPVLTLSIREVKENFKSIILPETKKLSCVTTPLCCLSALLFAPVLFFTTIRTIIVHIKNDDIWKGQNMSVYSMIFSPTGGTEKVMKLLEKDFQTEKRIDLTKNNENYHNLLLKKEDLCLIGVPSYGGRVPQAALERLRQINGNGAIAIIVVVYGNRAYDDTLLELKNELTDCNFQVVSAIAAVAEHSIMHQFGAGRPDAKDEQDLHEFAQDIKVALRKRTGNEALQVPGKQPYREYGGVPFKPQANEKCRSCGQCSAQCPVGAISKDHPTLTDQSKCISCMRCISICPQNARGLHKAMLFVASQKMKKACSERKNNELFVS
ncbi:MAG: 4Fe-4S binding protein [Hungatella sp.]